MAARDVPARTWLLATGAGWALVAWALALAGMARFAPPLPPAAAAGTLPAVRAAVAPRLGPPMMYAEINSRPLLSEDRKPRPFVIAGQTGEQTAQPAFDLSLTSVLITPGMQMAILQPPDGSQSLRVRVGESPDSQPAWRLAALSARSAVFEGPEGQRTLELRVFDGQGGAVPTQPSMPGVVPPPPPPMPSSTNNIPGPNAGKAPATFGGASAPGTTIRGPDPAPDAPTQPLTEDAQIEAIRQRIEARRAQLRQQAQPPPAPSVPVP